MTGKFKRFSNPILFLSDPPEATTGLARVVRDLASLACTLPEFRVATLGRGAIGNSRFPWTQFSYPEQGGQWGEQYLSGVCSDFFRGDYGIVMSNWDISRLTWLLMPQYLPPAQARTYDPQQRGWDIWGYVPVDATGPVSPAYGVELASALAGYTRVAAASEWGQGVLYESGRRDADWLPHGIWMDKFDYLRSQVYGSGTGKSLVGWPGSAEHWGGDKIVLGCVMSNQSRKDWPVAFECAARLKQIYGSRFLFWAHTDLLIHYWNFHSLVADYGLSGQTEITSNLNDDMLALRYSASDCTILPSAGEGFGFPIAESQACGTPCVVSDYAAGQEIVDPDCRVPVSGFRIDTQYNLRRAVLSGDAFSQVAQRQIEKKREDWEGESAARRERVEHLGWDKLKHVWSKWLREGLA